MGQGPLSSCPAYRARRPHLRGPWGTGLNGDIPGLDPEPDAILTVRRRREGGGAIEVVVGREFRENSIEVRRRLFALGVSDVRDPLTEDILHRTVGAVALTQGRERRRILRRFRGRLGSVARASAAATLAQLA